MRSILGLIIGLVLGSFLWPLAMFIAGMVGFYIPRLLHEANVQELKVPEQDTLPDKPSTPSVNPLLDDLLGDTDDPDYSLNEDFPDDDLYHEDTDFSEENERFNYGFDHLYRVDHFDDDW